MWSRNNPLVAAAAVAAVLAVSAIALVAFYAPVDQDGLNQKIFYFHVPIALTAYACFGLGALKGFLYLWKGDDERDLESYVAVHQGVIFGLLTLVTGSIWAKISWGHWWEWGDRQLVLFLILFLFYCAYFMLRFSIEPGPQRASISSVFALIGVVLIPISFLAIRLAESLVHPVTFTRDGPQMAGSQFATFVVCLAAMLSIALHAVPDRAGRQAPRPAPARAPGAARVTAEEKYVAAAYLVVFAFLLVYVLLIATKLSRLERDVEELTRLARERKEASGG